MHLSWVTEPRPTSPRVRSFHFSRITRFLCYLSLTLLVTKIVANNHDATITTNDFALVADLLNAWLYLHD